MALRGVKYSSVSCVGNRASDVESDLELESITDSKSDSGSGITEGKKEALALFLHKMNPNYESSILFPLVETRLALSGGY